MCGDGHKWCFAWFEGMPLVEGTAARIGLAKASRWISGEVIKIAFLDGTERQIGLVRKFAPEWINGLANLTLSWGAPVAEAHVRITFKLPGSWSVIGTTCKNVLPKTRPTMNFGWLTPSVSENEARRVILHEFGHALGFVHEHQRMDSDKWNRDAVIGELSGPPNNWDPGTIEHNMFDTFPENSIDGSELDETSIMMYPVPPAWRTDGRSAGLNVELSATDRAFARKMYP